VGSGEAAGDRRARARIIDHDAKRKRRILAPTCEPTDGNHLVRRLSMCCPRINPKNDRWVMRVLDCGTIPWQHSTPLWLRLVP
jgi:hypothetical protein